MDEEAAKSALRFAADKSDGLLFETAKLLKFDIPILAVMLLAPASRR